MTQSKHPPQAPESARPEPGPRERVRDRMRQMAGLALLAAAPLTNAACDAVETPSPFGSGGGLPVPTCEQSPDGWARFSRAEAVWGSEAGQRIVLLTVTTDQDKPWLVASTAYVVEGGTLLAPSTAEPNVLRIKPDAGATTIRLRGSIACHRISEPMLITIGLGTAGKNPTVAIVVG